MFRETNNRQIAVHEDTKNAETLSVSSDVPDLRQLTMKYSKTVKLINAKIRIILLLDI
jgi:hypothetical protein